MSQLHTVIAIFAVAAAAGIIIGAVAVFLTSAELASAWHSQFGSKKECMNYYTSVGNTTKEANVICNDIPHK
jgi:hypothetical protein